jgi:flavin-dependent dehydrogenase
VTASLVESPREGKLIGMLSSRFFFREAAGPGFALVGDAGLHKDPTPGLGITDALRDARSLARAILAPGDVDAAVVRYWRQRDVESIDLFHFARQLADPRYFSPLNRLVHQRAPSSPQVMARLSAQVDRELSPFEVLTPRIALRWVAGAALRGNLGVVRDFFAIGKQNAQVQRARAERVALLR